MAQNDSEKTTTTFRINRYKCPDKPFRILEELGYNPMDGEDENEEFQAMMDKYFEFGEYMDLEIEVDEDLNIVGGSILPK